MNTHVERFWGDRWSIIYGSYCGTDEFAVIELNVFVQRCLPYVVECVPAASVNLSNKQHLILIGTAADNPLISELVSRHLIEIPDKPQGYTIAGMNCAWKPQYRMIIIAGHDPAGVLHGTEDLCSQIINPVINNEQNPKALQRRFDSLPDFKITDYPRIENRGIWTWGYVMYDYKQFIDNMARLKMNMLTIWNDCPPLNINRIIDYAHSRGIKLILGFHWGWGSDLNLGSAAGRQKIKENALREYDTNYSNLAIDGIYFQTLTEHTQNEFDGKSVAKIVSQMVNEISAELFKRNPELKIQFGLHATSIQNKYEDLADLDPRVTIVWEDAGTLPYSYSPEIAASTDTETTGAEENFPKKTDSFEKTLEYSTKLAVFRKDSDFAMVPKGWTCIDWANEFEHHNPFILGESHPDIIAQRLTALQPHWDKVNTLWKKNFHLAAQFYKKIINCNSHIKTMTGLIEDGLFEAKIQSSVAIFAETLWNPEQNPEVIRQSAKRLENAGNSRIPSYTISPKRGGN